MREFVVDASVSIKWAFQDPTSEPHTEHALAVLQAAAAGDIQLIQPSHWLVETAGVLARHTHARPMAFLLSLQELQITTLEHMEVLADGIQLAQKLQHHLFDTLYHAVALASPDRILVTADDRYFRKAQAQGQIMRLSDWPV